MVEAPHDGASWLAHPMSRRRFLRSAATGGIALGGAGALGSVLAACGSSSAGTTSSGPAHRGGTLIFARTADPQTLDPSAAIDTESIWTCLNLYDCLYTVTPDGRNSMPWLAVSHEVSADQRTWTFRLRHGVRFSDGRPLDAEDVKFSWERALKGPNAYILSAVDAIDTPNASTVTVHTRHPWGPLLSDVAMYSNAILPTNLRGASAAQFFQHPIGTGPFTLQSWSKGQSMKLTRNARYWRMGRPFLDSVTFTTVPDDNSRLIQLRGGQANIIEAPPLSAVANLQATPNVTVTLFPSTAVSILTMNEKRPQFADAHVRRAISYGIDRSSIIKDVLFGHGTPAASFFAPTWPFYDAQTPRLWYDPSEAKRQLSLSKYPNGFSATYAVAAGDTVNGSIAQIVQSNLKPIGIRYHHPVLRPQHLERDTK